MSLQSISLVGFGGDKIADYKLGAILAELQGFTFSGPLVGAGVNVAITVPEGIAPGDTIIKALSNSAGTFTNLTVKPTNAFASATLTLASVVAGNTCAANGVLYTAILATEAVSFDNVPPRGFLVGATDIVTAVNLAQAISAEDSTNVSATSTGAVVTVSAASAGTGGNTITLTSGSTITRSAATLSGGGITAGAVSIVSQTGSGTLTLASAVAGNTATVGGVVFTLTTVAVNNSVNLAPGVVQVGPSDTVTATNLAAAINAAYPGQNKPEYLASSLGAIVTVVAALPGTAGNAITLVGGANVTASAATLVGGSALSQVKISSDTTGTQVFLIWFDKDAVPFK